MLKGAGTQSKDLNMRIFNMLGAALFAGAILSTPAVAQSEGEAPPPEEQAIPEPTIDTDGDGTPDAWDQRGDGRADSWDMDGDGRPDVFDQDGDGQPDDPQE